ncbi:MAG: hypothetical protein DWQ05_19640 [Calditrichaeota bacterium]|nr:MAG: hypothetical protein DWQ05_19640 [Calditrichota bacterium]
MEIDSLAVENIYGLYALSMVILFLSYVILYSIYEGYKKEFHWRWAVIILLSMISFVQFGLRTGTFSFMIKKTGELIAEPPWKTTTTATKTTE